MKLITAPSGHRLLMIWRTEFLFYTPERRRLAEEWSHVRLTSDSLPETASLINHQLESPLPLPDESCDAIYCFHTIEHLRPRTAERFVRDLHRLLKPGAILRISTPDLAFHAADYLRWVREQIATPSPENYARYRWAVCNLIDQCAREISGGEMLEVIRHREYIPEHVKEVNGDLLYFLFPPAGSAPATPRVRRFRAELLKDPALLLRKIAGVIRRWFGPRLPSQPYLELTHERNLWMFDRVSLGRLFTDSTFCEVRVTDYRISDIPGWDRYRFDESAFGDYPLEPSLFMEGKK
ncbi:MAG: hypothetical protein QOH39_769 [Verrucomicrobiota bacterium]|jgi:predicted SAM-dependent methyltransferase